MAREDVEEGDLILVEVEEVRAQRVVVVVPLDSGNVVLPDGAPSGPRQRPIRSGSAAALGAVPFCAFVSRRLCWARSSSEAVSLCKK